MVLFYNFNGRFTIVYFYSRFRWKLSLWDKFTFCSITPNVVELSNRFSSAVSVGNGGEMIFLTHRDQLISDACKNLIKSAITCWNYMFMTRHIQKLKTVEEKEELIKAIKSGTAIAWRHIYFNGLYDFSEEKLADSFNLLASQNYDLNLE